MITSPFRYPGGKGRLTNAVWSLIRDSISGNVTYIEPFAGGAGIATNLLVQEKVQQIVINDSDYGVYAAWDQIVNNTDKFIERIQSLPLTMESWYKARAIFKNQEDYCQEDVGLSSFVLNRMNRSGVMSGGVIGGYSQSGNYKLDARFKKNELIRRIQRIGSYSDRIVVSNLDARSLLSSTEYDFTPFYYVDPPYFVKGSQLYKHHFSEGDHKEIRDALEKIGETRYWLLTYDYHEAIRELYSKFYSEVFELSYSAGKTKKGKEIAVYSPKLSATISALETV